MTIIAYTVHTFDLEIPDRTYTVNNPLLVDMLEKALALAGSPALPAYIPGGVGITVHEITEEEDVTVGAEACHGQ